MTSEQLVERLPLTFTDTPDYAEVRDAQGTLIALTTDPAFFTRLQEALAAAEARIAAKDFALAKIERWFGEFPATEEFWDKEKTRPMSYAACFGSNGERDFMRDVARSALTSNRLPALLAETRKKALEEAAQVAEGNAMAFQFQEALAECRDHDHGYNSARLAIATAIRSLSADEAQP